MYRFILKRILLMIPVLLAVTVLSFYVIRVAPADPILMIYGMEPGMTEERLDYLRHLHGLDLPLPIQYFRYMADLLQGDLGKSIVYHRPVSEMILERFPATLLLGLTGLAIGVAIGLPLGVFAAVKQDSLADQGIVFLSVIGVSTPIFWLATMVIYFFAVSLRWFPATGSGTIMHLILPSSCLALGILMANCRFARSQMLEVLREDYVRTARSKGLKERVVIFKHALRNALIPLATQISLEASRMLGGALIIEVIFAWPGLGRLFYEGLISRDYPLIQGGLLYIAIIFVFVNLFMDILYTRLDPRIRLTGKGR